MRPTGRPSAAELLVLVLVRARVAGAELQGCLLRPLGAAGVEPGRAELQGCLLRPLGAAEVEPGRAKLQKCLLRPFGAAGAEHAVDMHAVEKAARATGTPGKEGGDDWPLLVQGVLNGQRVAAFIARACSCSLTLALSSLFACL